MQKQECINVIKTYFTKENIKDVMIYRSTSDCNKFMLEKINPNHIGIVYGQRNKHIRKNKFKGNNSIMIAKVFFGNIAFFLSFKIKERLESVSKYIQMNNINIFEFYTLSYLIFAIFFIFLIFNMNPMLSYVKKCQ